MVDDGKGGGNPFGGFRRNPDVVGYILQFTMSELGAAPLVLRNIGRTLAAAAPFLLRAGETRMTMTGKDGNQILLPLGFDPVIFVITIIPCRTSVAQDPMRSVSPCTSTRHRPHPLPAS